jgi:hypothetical protein
MGIDHEGEGQSHRPAKKKIRIRVSSQLMDRLSRKGASKKCMMAMVRINDQLTMTLFDSGSTTDSICPSFARVHNLKVGALRQPVNLQLGTVGSRSKINFGSQVFFKVGNLSLKDEYFDVVNIDKYDALIGTVFMEKYGVILDFATGRLIVNGQVVPRMSEKEEEQVMARRQAMRNTVREGAE